SGLSRRRPQSDKCGRVPVKRSGDPSVPNPNDHELFNDVSRIRFNSPLSKISSSGYNNEERNDHKKILEQPLLLNNNDEMWDNLRSFYDQLGYTPQQLLEINLFEYHKSGKGAGKKFVSKLDKQVLAHSISFIFPADYFKQTIKAKRFNLDLSNSITYRENVKLAGFNYDRYSTNFEVFKCMFTSQINNLVKHTNIHRYYYFSAVDIMDPFFEKLGFERIAVDVESKFGEVKLGSKRFERCLYGIDSDKFISRPEIITLLKTVHWERDY
ncbi:XRE family transcriptional regulator, partial [uncultured Vibrio sp.]|uniref:XRE family transcriptional regulator n=1 Tax=uncultured Vibrio sp. TaxID=114054 RepID=UPI0026092A79